MAGSPQFAGKRAGKARINALCYPKVPDVFQEDIAGQGRKPAGRRPPRGRNRGPTGDVGFRKVRPGFSTDIDPMRDT